MHAQNIASFLSSQVTWSINQGDCFGHAAKCSLIAEKKKRNVLRTIFFLCLITENFEEP